MPEAIGESICSGNCVVAEADGHLVGFGTLNVEKAEIDAVFARPDCLRSGVGGKLLVSLEQLARDAGIKTLGLSSSLNAVRFYEAGGYKQEQSTKYVNVNKSPALRAVVS
jgi:N-acetylglutamate synthase-like GNAT family acetyltransferase